MITTASPIVGPSSGTLRQARDYLGWDWSVDQRDYLTELWRLCGLVGFDAAILAAQSAHETANWSSRWWQERRNPAGIGITGDPAQNEASHTWANGTEAARAHVVHMTAYASGGWGSSPLRQWIPLDPRWQAVFDVGFAGTVRVLGDLGNGRWATDPDYAQQIAAKANQMFKEAPVADLTFGRVPHPAFEDRPITKAAGAGQDNLGRRTVKGVSWHRMLGSLWGTDTFFRDPAVRALTDYGVGVAARDGADHDGEILRWNDALGDQSGWASGTYSNAAYGDGAAFVARYGVDAINRDRASIEISGDYGTPLSDGARQAIADLTAYWADQAHIPWDSFPIVPADGFSFVCWHNEFGPDFGQKVCPGAVVMQETAALIERTREILRAAQTASKPMAPKIYAEAELPDWFEASLAQLHPTDQRVDGVKYWACRRNYAVRVLTTRRSAPDPKAPVSGPKLQAGEKIHGERVVENGRQWVLTNDGHYVLASKLSPAVKLVSR